MSHQRRVIADWPKAWATPTTKKTEDVKRPKSLIADSMKMKRHHGGVAIPLKRLKPISKVIRKPNGDINKSAVRNLISSLEAIMASEK